MYPQLLLLFFLISKFPRENSFNHVLQEKNQNLIKINTVHEVKNGQDILLNIASKYNVHRSQHFDFYLEISLGVVQLAYLQ